MFAMRGLIHVGLFHVYLKLFMQSGDLYGPLVFLSHFVCKEGTCIVHWCVSRSLVQNGTYLVPRYVFHKALCAKRGLTSSLVCFSHFVCQAGTYMYMVYCSVSHTFRAKRVLLGFISVFLTLFLQNGDLYLSLVCFTHFVYKAGTWGPSVGFSNIVCKAGTYRVHPCDSQNFCAKRELISVSHTLFRVKPHVGVEFVKCLSIRRSKSQIHVHVSWMGWTNFHFFVR